MHASSSHKSVNAGRLVTLHLDFYEPSTVGLTLHIGVGKLGVCLCGFAQHLQGMIVMACAGLRSSYLGVAARMRSDGICGVVMRCWRGVPDFLAPARAGFFASNGQHALPQAQYDGR